MPREGAVVGTEPNCCLVLRLAIDCRILAVLTTEAANEARGHSITITTRRCGGRRKTRADAAVKWMRAQPNHNGKVGLFGSCSGGRHAFIYACQKKDVDACAELWGGRVVMGKEELNAKTPVAPIEMTKDLACPLIGLFGNDDRAPSPEQVNQHEAELKKHGKAHEFHRYDGAGHGIFYWHRPLYRPEQAMDGWGKVLAFFGKHLAK